MSLSRNQENRFIPCDAKQNQHQERMMVILNSFGPAWDSFGSVSQFVLKIETYLRMANIEFQTKSLGLEFG